MHEAGDHLIVVGTVVDAGVLREGSALGALDTDVQYRQFGR